MQTPFPALVAGILQNQPANVNGMVERINAALLDRATYERSKAPNGSHIELRRVVNGFADSKLVAACLIALNASPEIMLNKSRKSDKRADLKGLQKVRKLFDYATGRTHRFDAVSIALFSATIIAALNGCSFITNTEQELILSNEKIGSLPEMVQKAVREYQLKHMRIEGDSRTQSCRFRTTFENLGLYFYSREDMEESALGISVILENPLIQYLIDIWGLEAF